MFGKLILLTIIPLAWGYAIKVNGKVELGEDLALVFDEIKDKILRENIDDIIGGKTKLIKEIISIQQKNLPYDYIPVEPKEVHRTVKKDLTVLDEIVDTRQQKAHVFGKHIERLSDQHHNNINV